MNSHFQHSKCSTEMYLAALWSRLSAVLELMLCPADMTNRLFSVNMNISVRLTFTHRCSASVNRSRTSSLQKREAEPSADMEVMENMVRRRNNTNLVVLASHCLADRLHLHEGPDSEKAPEIQTEKFSLQYTQNAVYF